MEKENLRLVFMGTPRISAYVFESMIEDGYHFVGLIAQPDRPVGRHGELEKVPTKLVAEKYGIPVFQPLKIRKEYEFVKDLEPDLIITLAYGQIVPQGLLDIPKYGCLNLHGSLLPKYRGAAPIQYALINNEKMTGMTLMEMIAEMDAGRMYAKQKVEITPDDNATSLFKKMGLAAKDLILENLPLYVDGQLPGELQNENLITFAPTIKIEQERIDLSQEADQILGWIRALSDRPGAYFILDGAKIKVFRAELVKLPAKGQVGEVIKADKDGLVIQLNGGQLSLLEVQKEGKKRMDYRSFINGNHQLFGRIFE
ncbi:MAG TPA: methionyl-tRNA formyltransferase [Bacilli bacterium]|nr:methionyl-tRNA formyltransferase [Bacilli bacterium]